MPAPVKKLYGVLSRAAPCYLAGGGTRSQWAVWEQGSLGQFVTPWYDDIADAAHMRSLFEASEARRWAVALSAQEQEGYNDAGVCSVWYDRCEGDERCGVLDQEGDLPGPDTSLERLALWETQEDLGVCVAGA